MVYMYNKLNYSFISIFFFFYSLHNYTQIYLCIYICIYRFLIYVCIYTYGKRGSKLPRFNGRYFHRVALRAAHSFALATLASFGPPAFHPFAHSILRDTLYDFFLTVSLPLFPYEPLRELIVFR